MAGNLTVYPAIIIAISGNALIKDGSRRKIQNQLEAVQETAGHIADLIEPGHDVVISHGNGPQVRFILRRSELAFEAGELHFVPLINCVPDTQGAIGYQIQESLTNALRVMGIIKSAATVVTMVEVDPNDPSFENPSKPVGVFYEKHRIDSLNSEHPDWQMVHVEGKEFSRF